MEMGGSGGEREWWRVMEGEGGAAEAVVYDQHTLHSH